MSPPLLLKRCLFNFYIKHILYMFIVVVVVVVAVVVIKISIKLNAFVAQAFDNEERFD